MQPQTINEDTMDQHTQDYAQFIRWTISCSRKELLELDNYIQEKIRDLVGKFKVIAENAASSTQAVPEDLDATTTIKISGKEYTYSQATKELHRLTDAVLSEEKLTSQRMAMRKKIDQFSLALFKHAEGSEIAVTKVLPNIQIITANIKEIIMAFQFQDFVKQRLTHIDLILETLEQETETLLSAIGDNGKVPDAMAENLLGKFFLSNVKETFIEGLDPAQVKNLTVTIEADDEDDIELF